MPKLDRPELRWLLLLIALPLIFDKVLFLKNSILGSDYLYYAWSILSFGICCVAIFIKIYTRTQYDKPKREALYLLVAFCAVSLLSLGVGFAAGNAAFYVFGDFLKFSLFALVIAVFLMFDLSRKDVHVIIAWVMLFYFLTLLKDVFLYLYVVDPGKLNRPLSVYLLSAIALLYIAARAEFRQWPGAVLCGVGCIVLFPVVAFLSDSLALGASFLVIAGFFLVFSALRSPLVRTVVVRITCVVSLLAILGGLADQASLIDLGIGLPNFDTAFSGVVGGLSGGEASGYTEGKIASLKDSRSLLDAIVLLSGDRALFIYAAATQWGSGWNAALFGRGLGGEVILPFWELSAFLQGVQEEERQHFIEMAYPEMFIRSGLLGLVVFISIFAQIARVGISLYRKNTHPPLIVPYALAVLAYLLVSFIAYADFPKVGVQSPWMIGLIAAAVMAEKREKALRDLHLPGGAHK